MTKTIFPILCHSSVKNLSIHESYAKPSLISDKHLYCEKYEFLRINTIEYKNKYFY
jgi:hypothetical protein